MRNIGLSLTIFAFSAIISILIYYSIIAMYNCGFGNSMLYGKNILWAYWMGYCD